MPSFGLTSLVDGANVEHTLTSIDWCVVLADTAGHAKVTQKFVNEHPHDLEVTYTFPALPSASVCGLRAQIGTNKILGRVVGKEQARVTYDNAVTVGRSAALLEQHAQDVLVLKIGRLPAGGCATVVLEMALACESEEDGTLRFALPIAVGHRYPFLKDEDENETSVAEEIAAIAQGARGPGSGRFGLNITLDMPSAISGLDAPQFIHELISTTDSSDPRRASASLALSKPPTDELVLSVKLCRPFDPRCFIQPYADMLPGQEGGATEESPGHSAALAVLHPDAASFASLYPTANANGEGDNLEFVFLLDRSGSMGALSWGSPRGAEGTPIRRMAAALQLFLRSLPTRSRVNLVGFGSRFECLYPAPVDYSEQVLQACSLYATSMRADMGGTELEAPLESILARPPVGEYQRRLIVLTDGSVANTERVLNMVRRRALHARTTVHTVGIGTHVSHALVDGLAEAGGGTAEYVALGERMEPKVIRQLRRALSPPAPVIERVEWVGEEWTRIDHASPDAALNGFSTSVSAGNGDVAMDDAGDFEILDVSEAQPPPLASRRQAVAMPAYLSTFCASTSGAGGLTQGRLAIPCNGQRLVVAALLQPGVHIESLRLHLTRHGYSPTTLDMPVTMLPAGRMLHASVGRVLVQQVEDSAAGDGLYGSNRAEASRRRKETIQEIGTLVQLVTKHTSLVAATSTASGSATGERMVSISANGGAHRTLLHSQLNSSCGSADQLLEEQIEEFDEGFAQFDRMREGTIEATHHGTVLRSLGHNTTSAELGDRIDEVDADGNETVEIEEIPTYRSLGACNVGQTDVAQDDLLIYRSIDASETAGQRRLSATSGAAVEKKTTAGSSSHVSIKRSDEVPPSIGKDLLVPLVVLQSFDGSWALTDKLACAIGIGSRSFLERVNPADVSNTLWATALALAFLEVALATRAEEWGLLACKAHDWIRCAGVDPATLIVQARRMYTMAS